MIGINILGQQPYISPRLVSSFTFVFIYIAHLKTANRADQSAEQYIR